MNDCTAPASDGLAIARFPGPLAMDGLPLKGMFHLEKFDVPVEWYAAKVAKSRGTLDEIERVARMTSFADLPSWLQQAADALMRQQQAPYAESDFPNGILNAGITAMLNILFGNTSAANSGASAAGANAVFNNTQARLAVGDSSTAFAASQTWLQAATNKFAQVMDATYPSVASQTISFRITVAGANANYAWNEFVIDNGGGSNSTSTTLSGGSALCRAVSAQGTKASGQTWVPTYQLTPGN